MNDQDLVKIRKALKEDLSVVVKEELKEAVRVEVRTVVREEVRSIVKEELEPVNERLDALTGDVHDLQKQVGVAFDKISLHSERNKREIDEIKDHLELEKLPPLSEAA